MERDTALDEGVSKSPTDFSSPSAPYWQRHLRQVIFPSVGLSLLICEIGIVHTWFTQALALCLAQGLVGEIKRWLRRDANFQAARSLGGRRPSKRAIALQCGE